WFLAYGLLGAAALAAGAPSPLHKRPGSSRSGFSPTGLAIAAIGYPLGRRLLRDTPLAPPPDPFLIELAAIVLVATVEEVTWGGIVEPRLGRPATAALFAAKHVAIDQRCRRSLGLFTFWMGLGMQRQRWPAAALTAHAMLNAGGVVQGHLTQRDAF
ncbi:MAG TPA: hypothetical protein VGD57_09355, partial [Candidatus Dormibacteraeota bacterium]